MRLNEATAARDGEPTRFVTVPLTDEGEFAVDATGVRERQFLGLRVGESIELLQWHPGVEVDVRAIPIRVGGVLGELKQAASRLSALHSWHQAHAATFVLTGTSPPPFKARISRHEPSPWWSARRTISIEVPVSTPPGEVEAIYRQARSDALDTERPRALTERHAALASFAYRHRRGMTWAELRKRWTRAHPSETKGSLSNFTRDCRSAFKRVTGSELEWLGKAD